MSNEHVDAIREMADHLEATDGKRVADEFRYHADALAAQLAEAEASKARIWQAFTRAELRVELWEASQDQTTEIWLKKWGLEPRDLPVTESEADR